MYLQKISAKVSFACEFQFHYHLSCKKTRNLFANLPQIYVAACLLGQSGHCFSVNSPRTCMKRHSVQLKSCRGQFWPVPFITLSANYYQRQNKLKCGKKLPTYLAARFCSQSIPSWGVMMTITNSSGFWRRISGPLRPFRLVSLRVWNVPGH